MLKLYVCVVGNSDITILPNVNTLQCILNVVGAKVSFAVPNSLASVLGFNRSIYGVGRHPSEHLVNIMSVNSILVHCNIHSSYMRDVQAPVVYNFFPNAAPGQKVLEAPSNLIYLPVTVDVISTLSVRLTERHWIYVERNWIYVFIFVNGNMYVQYKVNVSENQVNTLKDVIRLQKVATLCFPKGGIRGNHVLLLTSLQINRLDETQAEGSRVQIRMSARQVATNVSYTGGFFAALAPFITRALSFTSRVLPTIMSGLATGLLFGSLHKAISGNGVVEDGLYLHKHDKCYRVQKGNGLYLAPHPRFVEGDGLFLKHDEDISDGAGLLMGKNSPFKNIPALDGYCNYLFVEEMYIKA